MGCNHWGDPDEGYRIYEISLYCLFNSLWIYSNFKIEQVFQKFIYEGSQWWETGWDWVGLEVLEWERSEHIFLVCGERNQNRGMSFSCALWHFFPLGGRKWQAGWKDLEAKGSKDCLHCNFWTLEGHPPHHEVALYPEHSQPLSAI